MNQLIPDKGLSVRDKRINDYVLEFRLEQERQRLKKLSNQIVIAEDGTIQRLFKKEKPIEIRIENELG